MSEDIFGDDDTPVENEVKNSNFFDGKKRPSGKWVIVSFSLFVFAATAVYFMFSSVSDDTSAASAKPLAIEPSKKDVEVGGKGNPEYNASVLQVSTEAAEKAEAKGQSYVATPVHSGPVSEARPVQAAAQQQSRQAPQDANEINAVKQHLTVEMNKVTEAMTYEPQTTITYIKPEELNKSLSNNTAVNNVITNGRTVLGQGGSDSTVSSNTIRLPGGIHAGSILYAVNDLRLSSDGKNPIVRASIISGPLNHYTALGAFENGGESLSVVFTRIISPAGVEYPIQGFGIDPSVPEANVASDVDYHTLSRWGGFMAASFLTGFADATRMSGTSSSAGVGAGAQGLAGYGTMTIPTYSLMQKGVVGVGEVGRAMANELKSGLKRPPTVTLDPGITMGILIIDAGKSFSNGTNNSPSQAVTAQ